VATSLGNRRRLSGFHKRIVAVLEDRYDRTS
jgi:hypothetical protein